MTKTRFPLAAVVILLSAVVAQAQEQVVSITSKVDCGPCSSRPKSESCCHKLWNWLTYRAGDGCGTECRACKGCVPQSDPPLFAFFLNDACPIADPAPAAHVRHKFNLVSRIGGKSKCICGDAKICESCMPAVDPTCCKRVLMAPFSPR